MPGHVQRRQAPPGIGHEPHRVNREVLVVDRTAHHPQRKLRTGFPRAQAVRRQPALLTAAGPRTAGDPFHRPGIPFHHHVRRTQKGTRLSIRLRTVPECSAPRGFAHRCSRKVQARRSPQLFTSCGLHSSRTLREAAERASAYQGLTRSRPVTPTAQLKNDMARPPNAPGSLQKRQSPHGSSATDPATRPANPRHWACNVTTTTPSRLRTLYTRKRCWPAR